MREECKSSASGKSTDRTSKPQVPVPANQVRIDLILSQSVLGLDRDAPPLEMTLKVPVDAGWRLLLMKCRMVERALVNKVSLVMRKSRIIRIQ